MKRSRLPFLLLLPAAAFTCLPLYAFAAGEGTPSREVPVTLAPRPLAGAFPSGSAVPLRFPLTPAPPPWKEIELPEGIGGERWFGLAPRGEPPGLLFLIACRKEAEGTRALLYADRNGNRNPADDGEPSEAALLPVKAEGGRPGERHAFFPEVELPPPGTTAAIRILLPPPGKKGAGRALLFTRTVMEGVRALPGKAGAFRVLLLDGDGDGRFTRRDRWALQHLAPSGKAAPPASESAAFTPLWKEVRLEDGEAWHVSVLDAGGRTLSLAPGPAPAPTPAGPPSPPPPPRPTAEVPIAWLTRTPEALSRAAKEKRPVLVLLVAAGDGEGKARMLRAFRDLDVAELAAAFVPLLLETKDDGTSPLPFGIPGLPSIAVLDPAGRVVRRFPGYRPPERLVPDLESVIR